MSSVCLDCVNYCHVAAKIHIDPYFDEPPETWCEENSENFLTDDGCWLYEESRRNWNT